MINSYLSRQITQNFPYDPTEDQVLALNLLSNFLLSEESDSLLLLKGYAGTGKTSLVGALVKTMAELKQKSILLAPTGRAAKVFSGYAGQKAFTIHKKIYRQKAFSNEPTGFHPADNLHKDTLFIVDEASMIANEGLDSFVFGTGRLLDDLVQYVYSGENCRLILMDDVGCWNVKDKFFKEMSDAGIEVHAFLKVAFPVFTSKVNYRNHRKIVVIDGKVGFMGGMNIADRYTKGTSWGTWRDTHFKIIGKGVHGLQAAFLIDWYVVSKKLLNEKIYYPPLPVYSDDNIMQICTSGPVGQWRTLLQAAIFTVANAKKYVFIQTPYFLPTEGLNQALQIAALGGVDVRLMLPKRSDTRTANMATHSFIDEMVKAGVKVYFYKPGFLHSKLMVADDELTCIGSANMDFRSFEHNFEINAFVYQPSFAQQMRKVFLHDMHSCERLVPSRWLKRPLKQRIAESFMRLFSPLL